MASNTSSNEIDWGLLQDLYADAEEKQRVGNELEQAERDAADRERINQAFKDMESQAYANLDKNLSGDTDSNSIDLTSTDAFKKLMEDMTQATIGSRVVGAGWENLLANPEQARRAEQPAPGESRDPWQQVMQRLTDAQENLNFQQDFKREQADWRKYQEELADWNKRNQQSYDQYYNQLSNQQNADMRASQGINRTSQERGGAGQSWFFTPEGQEYLAQQDQLDRSGGGFAPSWEPIGDKPSYTGNFGTNQSVAANRKKNSNSGPLF